MISRRELTSQYGQVIKECEKLKAERDLLRAELAGVNELSEKRGKLLTAAEDEAAGLREALKHQENALCIISDRQNGQISGKDLELGIRQIRSALARTPAQHRDRIVAEAKVEALREIRQKMHRDQTWCQVADMITDEAERLEKEAGND